MLKLKGEFNLKHGKNLETTNDKEDITNQQIPEKEDASNKNEQQKEEESGGNSIEQEKQEITYEDPSLNQNEGGNSHELETENKDRLETKEEESNLNEEKLIEPDNDSKIENNLNKYDCEIALQDDKNRKDNDYEENDKFNNKLGKTEDSPIKANQEDKEKINEDINPKDDRADDIVVGESQGNKSKENIIDAKEEDSVKESANEKNEFVQEKRETYTENDTMNLLTTNKKETINKDYFFDSVIFPKNNFEGDESTYMLETIKTRVNPNRHPERENEFSHNVSNSRQRNFSYNERPSFNNVVYPVNKKKSRENSLNIRPQKKSNDLTIDRKESPKINRQFDYRNKSTHFDSRQNDTKDYFYQLFQNISAKNQQLKNLTEKVCKVSQQKYKSCITNSNKYQYNLRERYDNSLNHNTRSSNQRGCGIGESFLRLKPNRDALNFDSNFLDLRHSSDKEQYVNNLKKNLEDFNYKKKETQASRYDVFADYDEKLDDLMKRRQNHQEKGHSIDKDLYNHEHTNRENHKVYDEEDS